MIDREATLNAMRLEQRLTYNMMASETGSVHQESTMPEQMIAVHDRLVAIPDGHHNRMATMQAGAHRKNNWIDRHPEVMARLASGSPSRTGLATCDMSVAS